MQYEEEEKCFWSLKTADWCKGLQEAWKPLIVYNNWKEIPEL